MNNNRQNSKSSFFEQLYVVIRNEFRSIFRDEGVVLIMLLAPIIYATIYSFAYSSEVLRDIPVGVVDMSKTPASRHLINTLNMGPNTHIAYEPNDMAEARGLLFARKIHGIVYIPEDYTRNIMGGSEATTSIYIDASYMLFYRQILQEVAAVVSVMNRDIEINRLESLGVDSITPASISQPIVYRNHTLFNPYLGYGTFVMPPVLMLILQQTLLIGICMIGGTWHERGVCLQVATSRIRSTAILIILGKTIVYAVLYGIIIFYLLHLHYRLFHYPMNGSAIALALFIGVYILAVIFMGIAMSTLFYRRETPLMVMLWSSIPLLMLSGVSFPHEAMPAWLRYLANIFPSTFATQGFVKIATEGASIREVIPELKPLMIACIVYLSLSYVSLCHFVGKMKPTRLDVQQHP